MDAVTYPHDAVASAIQEGFVPFKVNMLERHPDFKEACAAGRVLWGPTFVVADARGSEIRRWVGENGLCLHPDKTHVGDCRQPGQGFEFLGYRFENGRRRVREKSLRQLKQRIRGKTRRTRGDSLERIVVDLNATLRGWFGYYKHAYRTTFEPLDKFVRRRLRALLAKQAKRPDFGRSLRVQMKWPNKFFAAAGLFALHTAWQTARHSR